MYIYLIVSPTFTTIGQDATVGNGDVHTVTCRAEGESQIQYELLKGSTEIFGFQSYGSVVSYPVCCNRGFHYTEHLTLRMWMEVTVESTNV